VKVIWTRSSRLDLGVIQAYYKARNPAAAKSIVADIKHSASILERFPEAGRVGELKNCRLLPVSGRPFLLPYRIVDGEIFILAVFDGRRERPDGWR
jgi:toxin ParE1/3/4